MRDGKQRQLTRLLRTLTLAAKGAQLLTLTEEAVLLRNVRGEFRFPAGVLEDCVARRLAVRSGDELRITPEGLAVLKRSTGDQQNFTAQHSRLATTTVKLADGSPQKVAINLHESPLARLHARKDKHGGRYISNEQFSAGERLRRDFEKAGLRSRVTVNWDIAASAGSAGGSSAGELSDMAIDARKRLEQALEGLESSLRGVAVDVCCYLKGFEEVERERQWPPRSAKLMLRTALSVLASHYGYDAGLNTRRSSIRKWGDADHRPSLG